MIKPWKLSSTLQAIIKQADGSVVPLLALPKMRCQILFICRVVLFRYSRCDISWKQGRFIFFCLSVLLFSVKPVPADDGSQDSVKRLGNGNPIAGKVLSESERCQECHGEDGNSTDTRIPKHAGQYASYLIKQLRDFQSGARQHEVMTIMAEDLTETAIADIAAYFASQTPMQGSPVGEYPLATRLFFTGDSGRSIEACSHCHGVNGKGKIANNVTYPLIGGQNRVYLRVQLVNWQLGARTNSPDGVMNKIAKLLTDEEIDELVNYLSGL